MINALRQIYLSKRFFYLLGSISLLFVLGYFFRPVYVVAKVSVITLIGLGILDIIAMMRGGQKIAARRIMSNKLSNSDDNKIDIYLENFYPFAVNTTIIDELPFQFQRRNFKIKALVKPGVVKHIKYWLKPKERGEYQFGSLNVFVSSPLNLIRKRFAFESEHVAKVYPSYIQMHHYELMAISNKLTLPGIKKLRKLGHSMEFEHIREYVMGDDYRTLNWKATAKKGKLMVNQHQDEKSQQVYSLIDMGRVMKMPFDGLSLLDYAINASLVISNVAVKKEDRAGIITFSDKIHSILPAEKSNKQMHHIMELLYRQKTDFRESSFEKVYVTVRRQIPQRSMLLLYTNFESLSALHRQIEYLKHLAKLHLLVVVFFENTELQLLTENQAKNTEDIYIKTIAEKFVFEKKQIVKVLEKHGIHSILTPPKNLTVNAINKYLEVKSRGLL
jgi:uncharacterized protein (DUF58 family)